MSEQLKPKFYVKVEQRGHKYVAFNINENNKDITSDISLSQRRRAYDTGRHLMWNPDRGKFVYITQTEFDNAVSKIGAGKSKKLKGVDENNDVAKFVKDCFKMKPKQLFMQELKWKYLVRSAMRGKNIMMTGPAGCGKTFAAKAVAAALGRDNADKFFFFNMGSTQDPRSVLIGNTHFKQGEGTFMNKSEFVDAIQTPEAIILLDELSRAHPEAWNILMPVLDETQRYLRIDEAINRDVIKVADGVTFIATANIGSEYTSTRQLDRALRDRFIEIEMDILNTEEETELLHMLFPTVDKNRVKAIAEIADATRREVIKENPNISTIISTRASVEMAGLLFDGFLIQEAAEVAVYPLYPNDGGQDSERLWVKQLVQKYEENITDEGDLYNKPKNEKSEKEVDVDFEAGDLFDENDIDS